MFSSLWKTVVGGDSASDAGGGAAAVVGSGGGAGGLWRLSTSASTATADEGGLDEDAAADLLLTQFPAYGTNTPSSFDEEEDDEDDWYYQNAGGGGGNYHARTSPRGRVVAPAAAAAAAASGAGAGGEPGAAGPSPRPPQAPSRRRRGRPDRVSEKGGGGPGADGSGGRGKAKGKEKGEEESRKGSGGGGVPWDQDEMDLWRGDGPTGADAGAGGTKAGGGGAGGEDGGRCGADGPPGGGKNWRSSRRRRKRTDWSARAATAAAGGGADDDSSDGDSSDDEASLSSSEDGSLYWDAQRRREWVKGRTVAPKLGASSEQRQGQREGDHRRVLSGPNGATPGDNESDASSSVVGTGRPASPPRHRHRKGLSFDTASGRAALLRRRRLGAARGVGGAALSSVRDAASDVGASPSSSDDDADERGSGPGGGVSSSAAGVPTDEDDSDRYGGRQHWMPDRLCRHCYSCEAQFTVFRRRHHCRLCGQVFCSACSAYFVEVSDGGGPAPAAAAGTAGSTEDVAAGGSGGVEGADAASVPSAVAGTDAAGGESDWGSETPRTQAGSVRTMRACRMCYDQVVKTAGDSSIRPAPQRHESSSLLLGGAGGGPKQGGGGGGAGGDEAHRGGGGDGAEAGRQGSGGPRQTLQRRSGSDLLPSASAPPGIDAAPSDMSLGSLVTAPEGGEGGIADGLAGYQGSGDPESDFRVLSLMKKKRDEEQKRREEAEMVRIAAEAAVAAAAAISSDTPPSKAAAAASAAASSEGAKYKASAKQPSPSEGGSAAGATAPSQRRFGRKITSRLGRRFAGRAASLSSRAEASASDAGDKAGAGGGGGGKGAADPAGKATVAAGSCEDRTSLHPPTSPPTTAKDGPATAAAIVEAAVENSASVGNKDGDAVDEDPIKAANRRLGLAAADHLEKMGRELLESDAPLLLEEIEACRANGGPTFDGWVDMLMTLATRCCATVKPNVKKGDLLDVRPYCKLKVIPGGSVTDCAYMSGIIFHKNVSHKSMAREIVNPRIMLLSGGIEYTRTENRIASLDTLLEQEEKYMEILVSKIIKLKPDVLMVGRSVSRKAQELLLRSNVVLLQHVKSALMGRIARQTGATILSSTDHVMNQFGTSVLGKCRRFRLVTFRDNETWFDGNGEKSVPKVTAKESGAPQKSIGTLLSDKELPHHKRQAVLAANSLGEGVIDGASAVKSGLAKRGVALTYAMVEGCPPHLGCTVVLRGASRLALKQVKRVSRFLINVAYNLKLETSYLRERCAQLRPDYVVPSKSICSSSLCVDYGAPPHGRKVRPWNGGSGNDANQRSISGKITAFDHQSILITSVWMTGKNQCCPAEVKGICYYSMQDVSLGQFLRDSCFNLSLKCQNPSCKKSVLDHSLSFIHNDGLINITVEQMEDPLPPAPLEDAGNDNKAHSGKEKSTGSKPQDNPIATWSYCVNCAKVVTRLVYISESWNLSFGKFLEIFFYNRDVLLNSPEHGCSCQMQTAARLYFGCGRLAARFTYEQIRPYGVHIRRSLPFDDSFHRADALKHLEQISVASTELFTRFDRHIDKIARETRQLFGSAANKPEHLQTVLSELNLIGSEVDHAAKTLQEKFASVTNKYRPTGGKIEDLETLLRFAWPSRRYLFMLTNAWNERLSAAGQTLVAMKKRGSRGEIDMGTSVAVDGSTDEVMEGLKRLRQLREACSHFNVADMSMSYTGRHQLERRHIDDNEYHDVPDDNMFFDYDEDFNAEGGGLVQQPDIDIDFSDGVASIDADVLASRRRLQQSESHGMKRINQYDPARGGPQSSSRVTKSLGTRRQNDSFDDANHRRGMTPPSRHQKQLSIPYDSTDPRESSRASQQSRSRAVTAGGAVKSALTRFFTRGNKDHDPYTVDLGILSEGRPRLEPGLDGIVVPIFDEQPSTIIAHSLSSTDYDIQFKQFTKAEGGVVDHNLPCDGNERSVEDYFAGRGLDSQNRNDRQGNRRMNAVKKSSSSTSFSSPAEERKDIERRMLVRNKSHIKHTFRDFDDKGQQICKFVCTTYWATQFHAVRQVFLSPSASQSGRDSSGTESTSTNWRDAETNYVRSLAAAHSWATSGGKSGASFSRTADSRFIVKCISRTELQMFLDCAPAYFEYLSKAFFHGLPTVLCKIVGVYQIGYHNRVTGKKTMEQVAVMQNIFHDRKISKVFDLKGSLRGRFTQQNLDKEKNQVDSSAQEANAADAKGSGTKQTDDKKGSRRRQGQHGADDGSDTDTSSERDSQDEEDEESYSSSEQSIDERRDAQEKTDGSDEHQNAEKEPTVTTLLDGDFLEFTGGRPLPLNDRAKAVFHMSILNDTLFLSIINVLDYSILVGIDEEKMELVVGIIDFMRQYDILKQMERVGKSLPMVVGSEAPTIIQPPLYKQRFTNAMEKYFMTVPSKWTTI